MRKQNKTTVTGALLVLGGLALTLLIQTAAMGDEEITDMWRFSTETKEGERHLSHSLTFFRKAGQWDGTSGKKCGIGEGRENEYPLQKIDVDLTTRKVSFFAYWGAPENDDGSVRTYDAKFEGSIGDKNITGTLSYINGDDCLRPVESPITLTRIDTGVKSELVKEVASPTASVKGRYDVRLLGRPSVNDLTGKKTWVGGRGFAFIGGSKASFQDLKAPSQIELEFSGKGYDQFKSCHPIARTGASNPSNAIQIIGDGKMETKATKNPKNPVGLFLLKSVARCREIEAAKPAFR